MSEDKERTAIRRIDPDKYFAIRRKERRYLASIDSNNLKANSYKLFFLLINLNCF